MIKDEVTDKFKSTIIIPFMLNKGYKQEDLIEFFEISKEKYDKFVPHIMMEGENEYKVI